MKRLTGATWVLRVAAVVVLVAWSPAGAPAIHLPTPGSPKALTVVMSDLDGHG